MSDKESTILFMENLIPLVTHMGISYWRPATTDISIEVRFLNEARDAAVAEALESGKADFVIEADLTDANGKTVASTKGVYQVRALNFKAQ